MIYLVGFLAVLALLWDFSVWMWLRANPVPPLAEIPDWRVRRPISRQEVFTGVMAATAACYPGMATSAYALIEHKRGLEDRLF